MTLWNQKYHDKYKVYTLYGKTLIPDRYKESWKKVKANKGSAGIDRVTIGMFERQLDQHIRTIIRSLRNKTYKPTSVKRVEIGKPGSNKKRPLGIPTVRDRLVQQVLKELLEPIFDLIFSEYSYGYRPNKSAHDAIKQAEKYSKQSYWVIDADIKGFFDSVNHNILLDMVNEKVSDGSILRLIRRFLESGAIKQGEYTPTDIGTPQGGVISPLLANIYLNHLDRRLEERGYKFVRYADDFLVFCNTKKEAEHGLQFIQHVLEKELKLNLNMDKTNISYVSNKFDEHGNRRPERRDVEFLGFRMNKYRVNPSDKSIKRLKDKIRQETRRCWSRPVDEMINGINQITRGWGNYFKHSATKVLFSKLDTWIRMRIRMNLGKRKVRNIRINKRYTFISYYTHPNINLLDMGLITLSQVAGYPPVPCKRA